MIADQWVRWPVGDGAVVLALALAVELAIGDPVSRWHPVALFGRTIEGLFRRAPRTGRWRQLAYGAIAAGATVGSVALATALLLRFAGEVSHGLAIVLGAALLKASLSYRQLAAEAGRVADHLESGRLEEARVSLRALVSRDTLSLPPALAASAAVESVAENLSDSFVAPLLYYVLFGVPGALAYRAINTLDAQVGYHGPYEYIGRVAAKLDDAANLVPARLTAALLVLACALARADPVLALRTAWRDHLRTESPNAGWPMAAMAGGLRARLEKPGHYRLGEVGGECTASSIRRSVAVTRWATALAAGLAVAGAAWPRCGARRRSPGWRRSSRRFTGRSTSIRPRKQGLAARPAAAFWTSARTATSSGPPPRP